MIKVTIGEQKTQSEKPFPKLMINSNGCIRLVFQCGSSLILKSSFGEFYPGKGVLQENHEWNSEDFTDYNEPITLQNA